MEHFAHTAFLLVKHDVTSHVFLNEQRILMFINCNPYQNIFQMTLKFYRAVDDIVLLMRFAHTAFLLCQAIVFQ